MARNYDSSKTSAEFGRLTPKPGIKTATGLIPGIQDLRITAIEFKVPEQEDKKPYLSVLFKHVASGLFFGKSFFEPDESKHDEATLDKMDAMNDSNLKHIFGALTGIDYNENPVKGKDFADYCKNWIATLPANYAEIPIHWLKLVYRESKKNSGVYDTIDVPGFPPYLSTDIKFRDYVEIVKSKKNKYPDVFFPNGENGSRSSANIDGDIEDEDDSTPASHGGSSAIMEEDIEV